MKNSVDGEGAGGIQFTHGTNSFVVQRNNEIKGIEMLKDELRDFAQTGCSQKVKTVSCCCAGN